MRLISLFMGVVMGFGIPIVLLLIYSIGIIGHGLHKLNGQEIVEIYSRTLFWVGVVSGIGLLAIFPWLTE